MGPARVGRLVKYHRRTGSHASKISYNMYKTEPHRFLALLDAERPTGTYYCTYYCTHEMAPLTHGDRPPNVVQEAGDYSQVRSIVCGQRCAARHAQIRDPRDQPGAVCDRSQILHDARHPAILHRSRRAIGHRDAAAATARAAAGPSRCRWPGSVSTASAPVPCWQRPTATLHHAAGGRDRPVK